MSARATIMAGAFALAACGGPVDPPASAAVPAAVHEYDFGTIPYGAVREHVFDLGLPPRAVGLVPAGFQSPCSCGVAQLQIVAPDGTVWGARALPAAQRVLREGMSLRLALTLDTSAKAKVDLPRTTAAGEVVLRDPDDFYRTRSIPVVFHYAIDAPVQVRPGPHVAIGALATSQSFSQILELRPDQDEMPVVFGPLEIIDPRISASLARDGDLTLLEVSFEPGPDPALGPFRGAILVGADPEHCALEILVSGEIVPDIAVRPFRQISFGRFDLGCENEEFVNLTDLNRSRPAGFEVASITDSAGRSLAEHFSVQLEPIDGDPRSTRMTLRYLGTLAPPGFRGTVTLAKPGGAPPLTKIPFVGFSKDS